MLVPRRRLSKILRKTQVEADGSDGWLTAVVCVELWGDMAVIVGRNCVLSVHGGCRECNWRVPAVALPTHTTRRSGVKSFEMVDMMVFNGCRECTQL